MFAVAGYYGYRDGTGTSIAVSFLSYIFILWSTVEVFSRDFRLGIIRLTRIDSGSFCVSCIRIMYVVTTQLFPIFIINNTNHISYKPSEGERQQISEY